MDARGEGRHGAAGLRGHHPAHAARRHPGGAGTGHGCILPAARAHDLSCWVIDHVQPGTDPILECLAFLAYHAGRAPGLRWGTLVLGQRYRNPALTAKIAATLQHLTGGRFIPGLGAGDAEAEHRAYGYPFPPPRERVAQLDEAARIVTALWRGGPVTFAGEHYRVDGALCIPAPEPPPPC